jgi:hypothetical protein
MAGDKARTIAQLAQRIRECEEELAALYEERTQRAGEEDARLRQAAARSAKK